MFIKRCYVLSAVHAALMWSPRSPLLLSNVHLQRAAFGPVFLCPHEGKNTSLQAFTSVRFSFTLLPPAWIKVAPLEMEKLKLEKDGGRDMWQPFLPLINVPPSKESKKKLPHRCRFYVSHCDIHLSFPVTSSKYFQQPGERVPGSLT